MNALRAGAWVMLCALVACGGGGGDSSPSGPPPATTSGLVPVPPAPGATLTADASVLRPLRDGAVWVYRGTRQVGSLGSPTSYETRTTQALSGPTAASESFSNAGNLGPDAQALTVSGGTVSFKLVVDLAGNGKPETVDFVELRSPVRQGDQFTMLDRHYTDTAIDADRDGRADALDVALFGRVVGIEPVTLQGLPTVSAVRVDVTLRSRVTYSSNGQLSPVAEFQIQTWYARGIGIVRQRHLSPAGTDTEVVDEQLVSWDAGTEGFGAMPAVVAAPTVPGGWAVRAAVAFADHGLVVVQPDSGTGLLAVRLDRRGNLLSQNPLPGLAGDFAAKVLGHATGLVHLRQQTSVYSTRLPTIELTRLDADGLLAGSVASATIDLAGPRTDPMLDGFSAAIDGSTLWLLWHRIYNTPTAQERELILRPYTVDGAPLGPERVLDGVPSTAEQIAATGGRVLVTWGRFGAGYEAVWASVALGDTTVTPQVLANGMPVGTVTESKLIVPVAGGAHGALFWTAPLPSTPSGRTGALLLGADLAPVRRGVTLGDELLAGWPGLPDGAFALGATPDRTRQVLSLTTGVNWLAPGSLPLASTPSSQVAIATDGVSGQLVFDDRVLVIGGFGTVPLKTTLVWLNAGTAP